MKRFKRMQRVFSIFMLLSIIQSGFAFAQTPIQEPVGSATVILQSNAGLPVGGACYEVGTADGQNYSFCDDDGDGSLELTNIPAGSVTVSQTNAIDGYTVAAPGYGDVLPDQSIVLTMYTSVATPVDIPTTPATEAPTIEPPFVATEEATTAPIETVVADDAIDPNATVESVDGDSVMRPAADVSPLGFGIPLLTCVPVNNQEGVQQIDISLPTDNGQEMDPAPTASYMVTDRFGAETGPFNVDVVWTGTQYEVSGTFTGDVISFTITSDNGVPYTTDASCAEWNPIRLDISTMAKDSNGGDLVDGSQIGSSDTFSDTSWFVGENVVYAPELAGQTIYYNLYKDSADCSSSPVEVYEVIIDADGNIPASPSFDPSAEFGDGIYDWQVVFLGAVLDGDVEGSRTFSRAESICDSETVVVGDVEVDVATTMMNGETDEIIGNGQTIPIGSSIYDTTVLNGANDQVSGTVTYELYMGTCDSSVLVGTPEVVDLVDGVPGASTTFTPTELGNYFWVVKYSGDANGNGAGESGCGEETFTVGKASPSITTGMIAGGSDIENGDVVDLGTTVSDTTTIDGEYVPADGVLGGTVKYTLYQGTCPGGTVVLETAELPLVDGVFPASPDYTPTAAGDYFWVVNYSGDDFNNADTSGCGDEYFKVAAISTTISTAPQSRTGDNELANNNPLNNAVLPGGSDVADTAVVGVPGDSVPTGTVAYYLYSGSSCTNQVRGPFVVDLNEDGSVPPSPIVEGLPAGQYNWVAVYSGDETHAGSRGACGDEQFFIGQTGEVGGYITTQVKTATGANVADGGTVPLGSSGYDTATFFGDIVDANGNATVDGTLTFNIYSTPTSGATCSNPIEIFTYSVVAGEPIPNSSDDMYSYNAAGTYDWQAVFTFGDNQSLSSICGTETVVVNKVTPTFNTTMQLNGENQENNFRFDEAGSVSDTVTTTYDQSGLANVPAPTGTLTYTLYRTTNNTCTGEPVYSSGELTVAGGVWPASGGFALADSDYGVYNWVVVFTPDTAGAVNYNGYTSPCNTETFRKDVTPTLTTTMYTSTDGAGTGTELVDDSEVNVGDYVRDTATLTGFADGASGTVTFRLHQGGTCEGVVLFENTVQVQNGVAQSGTGWFEVLLSGEYSWSAEYTGDINGNSNTFTAAADSDCSTETFTALLVPDVDPEIKTIMRNSAGQVIEHGSFVDAPISVTDQAVFKNLNDQATGTVTYELFNTATCQSAPVHTSVKDVVNGLAPISDPYNISSVGNANGVIYSWKVTFQGNGDWKDVTLVSPCNAEQFRAYQAVDFSLSTVCAYNPTDNTMSVVVNLNPRHVDDTNPTMGATIVYTPLSRDLSPVSPASQTVRLDPGEKWIVNLGEEWHTSGNYQPWRRVTGTVTWDQQGSAGTFRVGCNTSKFNPAITTTMFYRDGDEAVEIPHDATNPETVPYGTTVFDTTQVTNGSSTVVISGTLTYTLYSDATCETVVGSTVRNLGDDTPTGSLPASDDFTLTQAGTYFWVVEYSGDANNNAATSPCGSEVFRVDQTEPTLTTEMRFDDATAIANGEMVPIDSVVTDTATIAGLSENATGTVTYELYRGTVCDDEAGVLVDDWTVNLNADGTVPNATAGIAIVDVGVYYWLVSYSGDVNNKPATSSGCEEWFQVELTDPTITTEMRYVDNTVIANEAIVPIDSVVTDTATMAGLSENATGTVTYTLYQGTVCDDEAGVELQSWTVTLNSDGRVPNATDGIKIEDVGVYYWVVSYSGDVNNEPATSSGCEEWFRVEQTSSEITTVMKYAGDGGADIEQGGIVPIDSLVIDTATIEGLSDNATGTVTYTLVRGESCEVEEPEVVATLEVDLTDGAIPDFAPGVKIEEVGTYNWIVAYSGDANNAPSVSPCGDETFVVEQTVSEITTVMKYAGDGGADIEQGGIVPIDSLVIDTATIEGLSDNATGTVTYTLVRGESCEVEEPEVVATLEVDLTGGAIPDFAPGVKIEEVGTYNWIVAYSGDANNAPSVSPCGDETFVVEQTSSEITTVMKYAGDGGADIEQGGIVPIDSLVIDTATIEGLSDNATGTVTYTLVRGESCEVEEQEVVATLEVDLTDGAIPDFAPGVKIEEVGTYNWIVAYSGDANNAPSVSPCGDETFVVEQAQPEVVTTMQIADEFSTVIENGSVLPIDTLVIDTAIITGQSDNATGTVNYQLFGAEVCGAEDGDLIVEVTVDLAEGLIPNFDPAQTIDQVGVYFWVVSYSGDDNNAAAISDGCDEWFQVNPTESVVTTVMKLADGTVVENDEVLPRDSEVLDTATISGLSNNATGTVTYQLYADALCETPFGAPYVVELVDGAVPDSLPVLLADAGSYYWVVSYSGDDNNAASVSGCGEEFFHIEQVSPSVVTTMKYADGTVIVNDEVVLTDSVVLDTAELIGATDDASGTATYQLFSDATCTIPVTEPQEVAVTNGVIADSATFTVTEPGTYYWVVTYSGDVNNASAVSGCGEEFFRAELPPVEPTPEPTVPATPHPTDPATPQTTVPPVTNLPSTGSGISGTALSLLLASMAGLMLAAVAVRQNASKRS